MFFIVRKSFIARFALILALLGGMLGVVSVQAAKETSISTEISPGETARVSLNPDREQGNGFSFASSISADGRYIAFTSHASNLVSGDTNGEDDIFVSDMQSGITVRVSVDSNGRQANDASFFPSISADGRYIAFASGATNLVSGDTNGSVDVFVHDMQTGATMLVPQQDKDVG